MSEEKEDPKPPPGKPADAVPEAPQVGAFDKAQARPSGNDEAELAALREKAAKADEYLDLARRARADFINYQDRVRRDRQDWTRQAVESFLRDVLPALDGFSLARFKDPALLDAVGLVEREFLRVLV